MSQGKPLTPMMEQYLEVKAKLAPGTLLFFRLGDFFEVFNEDAKEASAILGLTLTARNETPMAGMPAHAIDGYIRRLMEAGKKVAVCDQLEEAKPGKLVKRALTRVYTAGTALAPEHLLEKHNRYLLALDQKGTQLVASWMELSTGEWCVATAQSVEDFLAFLTLLDPAELVVPEEGLKPGLKEHLIEHLPNLTCTLLPVSFFEVQSGHRILCEALGVGSLKAFGLPETHAGIGTAAALYSYAQQALCDKPRNLFNIQVHDFETSLMLDPTTARQLEVFKSLDGSKEGSLLKAIDNTATAAGARLLERMLMNPSCDAKVLQQRYSTVETMMAEREALGELKESLKNLRDLERILGRLQNRLRSPRELAATRDTLRALPGIRTTLERFAPSAMAWICGALGTHAGLERLLAEALEAEPNNDLSQGNYIRTGYDARLDELKALSAGHKTWIAQLELQEQERTGIKSLKVKFNNNFGFFIEVTKANLARVPADYIRKSTTVSGERFMTEALQERQKDILGAESNAVRRELEIFESLVAAVIAEAEGLRRTAQALAWCDVMTSFAQSALRWSYCRPTLDEGVRLEIVGGRHAVVEQALVERGAPGERFVPNDTTMSATEEQILIITGPNMAGKSTYIRQVALIVLMAQIGSFVPATRAHIGLVDRVFSRIGSADALHKGESTFMVEMTETAYILRAATERSLVILDEIGRGTSTYDGLSIAWACAEYLHGAGSGPRTLFATHYHELTRLEKTLPRVRNYCVAVKEWGSKIIFVRQVIKGAADRSYGIHVAQLAGMPPQVIERATKLLEGLEGQAKAPKASKAKTEEGQEAQLGLF